MLRVLALASAVVATSCGADVFACSDDDDCASAADQGICAPAGACAFPDDDCPSGHRYGDHAGGVSGECVPPWDDTTGSDDSATGAPTTIDPDTNASTLDATSSDPDTTTSPADTSSTSDPTTPVTIGSDSSSDTTSGVDDPDLLVWLRFAELVGASVPNDGALGGAATCLSECPVVANGAAQFDGATTCLVVPHADPLNSPTFTAAAWVRRPDMPPSWFLFGKAYGDDSQNSWELYMSSSQRLGQFVAVEIIPDAVVSAPAPPVDTWAHVAATHDGSTMSLWVDGVLANQLAVEPALFDAHDIRVGCDTDAGVDVYFFPGSLADVRVYARTLDEQEIAELASTPPMAE